MVNFHVTFYHPIMFDFLSYTHAEGFLLSHAYARHSVNLFHVLKKGIPSILTQVYHLLSAFCSAVVKRREFGAGARVYQAQT